MRTKVSCMERLTFMFCDSSHHHNRFRMFLHALKAGPRFLRILAGATDKPPPMFLSGFGKSIACGAAAELPFYNRTAVYWFSTVA